MSSYLKIILFSAAFGGLTFLAIAFYAELIAWGRPVSDDSWDVEKSLQELAIELDWV